MNSRYSKILQLLRNRSWVTGKELSFILNVSDRTIRTDMKKINESGILIESNTKLGYRLANDNLLYKSQKSYSPDERRIFILKQLISQNNPLELQNLADSLFVSDSSLQNDINFINTFIAKYKDIKILKNSNTIQMTGDENSIRKLYKDLLLDETKNNLFNINQISSLYKKFDLISFKNILEGIFDLYNYKIRDIDFPILLIHLGVSLDRIIDDKKLLDIESVDYIFNTDEYKISKDFFEKIEHRLKKNIDESEVILFAKLLINKNTSLNSENKLKFTNQVIVKDLLKHIYENFGINLMSDNNLINSLCIHIDALISRIKFDAPATNLYLDEIKRRFPFIFEIAVFASNFLNNKLNINITEEEIGFISLHLGTSYERTYKTKYKICIISHELNNYSKKLLEDINKSFGDKIEIVKKYNYFEEQNFKNIDIDLIISCLPLYHSLDIPTVFISPFINANDESNISKAIRDLDKKKLKQEYGLHIKTLIRKENFYFNYSFKTKEDALQFLCKNLIEKGYVKYGYYQDVINRELISPTSFSQGFSIPHSISTENIIESTISILILDKSIEWSDFNVKIIFLLTIKSIDSPVLKLFFNWMDSIVDDKINFYNLLDCKNFDEFINLFNK